MNSEINLNTQLFIQGYDITHKDLSHICDLVMSLQYEKIDDYSWRIHQPRMTQDTKAAVQNYCNRSHIDLAYLPTRQSLHDFKLLAMDMDSTLITIECIDELALLAGVGEQVKAITAAAMRGEMRDFSDSLRRRVALLAGQPASLLQHVYDEKVKLSQGAQTLVDVAKAAGMKTLVVSGGFDFFTDRLQATLGLDDSYSNQLEIIDGKLTGQVVGTIVDGAEKVRKIQATCTTYGITPEQVIAIGDGANDIPMLNFAGLSVAHHAKPVVQAQVHIALNYVGLEGVLRVLR